MRLKPEDLVGLKYGEWEVLEWVGVNTSYSKIVKAKCSCGKIKNVFLATIKSGGSNSCGCKKAKAIKHGMSKTKLYQVWNGMKERCSNKNFKQYADYGGRGIKVYEYLEKDFKSFLYWCIRGGGYKPGLELDRIDNDKDYCPQNCRFTTHKVNNRNKRNNRWVVFNNEKRLLIELCEEYSMVYKTVTGRIKKGMSVHDSLTTPPKR